MRYSQKVVPSLSSNDRSVVRENSRPPFDSMEDSQISLASYGRILWLRRWIVLTIALGVFVTVLFGTLRQKPVFRATGSLEIDMPKGSVTSLGDLLQEQSAPDNYLQTQAEILRSTSLDSRLMTQLAAADGTDTGPSEPDQAALSEFQARLFVEIMKGSRLIELSAESKSPETAAKTVNQLMALYIEQTRQQHSDTVQGASNWLMDQLGDTEAKLQKATLTLQHYEAEHGLLFVETKDGGSQNIESERLQQFQADLARAQALRLAKETSNRQAQSGDPSVLRSPLLGDFQEKDAVLRQKLSQLDQTFGPNFPEVKENEEQLEEIRSDETAERKRIAQECAADLDAAARQEELARQAFEKQQKIVAGATQQMLQDSILKRDVDLDKQLYEGLLSQMNEAGVSSKLEATNARVFEPAQIPLTRIRPNVAYNLILGAFAGLTLGMGFAFFQEHLQDTFQSREDVETHLNLPLLATVPASPMPIPAHSGWSYMGRNENLQPGQDTSGGPSAENWFRLDRDGSSHFELSEAIRNLRTSLLFALDGAQPRSILISSAVPSEGKTTISANLSVALAQLGKRVLSIDGDLRRPSVHRIFSMANDAGLTDYLRGDRDWREFVCPSPVQGLSVIVSGGRPPNPAELLSSARMEELLLEARTQYDVVILDSPTVLNMADSRVLASCVEAVVLVIKSGFTPRKLVKQAYTSLLSVSARIVGVVLNQVDLRNEEYSYVYSNYSESSRPRRREDAG